MMVQPDLYTVSRAAPFDRIVDARVFGATHALVQTRGKS
jgi:hypothetical protein